MTQAHPPTETLHQEARRIVAAALALALTDPQLHTRTPQIAAHELAFLKPAWELMAEPCDAVRQSEMGIGELPAVGVDVAPLINWLAVPAAQRAAVMQRVFGLVISRICPPYESEYAHWKDATYRANLIADVAGFYHAFGFEPDRSEPDRHDHVALELQFIAILNDRMIHATTPDHIQITSDALAHFVGDHITWWLPTFAKCMERRIEQLLVPSLDDALRGQLQMLIGVTRVLRAWTAAQRIAQNVAPSRQIIAPEVEMPEPVQEICTTSCSECGV